MFLLDRYIFREVLVPMLIGLAVLTFMFVSEELGFLFEIIIRQTATVSELGALVAAVLPRMLTFTIPMSLLVGILTGFGRMSSDNEAIALRASGISMPRIMRPVLLLAVACWAVSLILALWIAPPAAARFGELEHELRMKQASLVVQPRVFNEAIGDGFVLYLQDRDAASLALRGIMLADMRKPEDPTVYFAQSGALLRDESSGEMQFTLANGNWHRAPPQNPSNYDWSKFEKMVIPISIVRPQEARSKEAAEAPTVELWRRMRAGDAGYQELVDFHQRIALPAACLVFVLVGFPLGVSTARGSKSMGLVLSLLLMLLYYVALAGGTSLAEEANFSPFLGAWLPNLIFAAFGVYLLSRSERGFDGGPLARLRSLLDSAAGRVAAVRLARPRMNRWAHSFTHHSKFFRLLDVYVLRGFWFFFVLDLFVFTSLFIIITLFELLPDIVKHNVTASVVLNYFLFLSPQILYWFTPLTVLLAVLMNLGALTKRNEVLAVKAAAISLYRMSAPLLATALLLSAALYFLQDFVLPYSNQRQEAYRNIIKGRAAQTYRDPRRWIVGSGDNRIYHHAYFDAQRNVLNGVSIFEFDPKTFDLRQWVFARIASWNGQSWTMESGWIHRPAADASAYEPFERRDFEGLDAPEYFKTDVRTSAQMTYAELKKYVDDLRQSGFDVTPLTLDLYRKLSFPMVSFIMAIIGVPFSFKTGRKGAFYGIGLSVAVGIVYWTAFELFDRLGGINRLSPIVAAWFPNLIFGVSGIWMMLRVRT